MLVRHSARAGGVDTMRTVPHGMSRSTPSLCYYLEVVWRVQAVLAGTDVVRYVLYFIRCRRATDVKPCHPSRAVNIDDSVDQVFQPSKAESRPIHRGSICLFASDCYVVSEVHRVCAYRRSSGETKPADHQVKGQGTDEYQPAAARARAEPKHRTRTRRIPGLSSCLSAGWQPTTPNKGRRRVGQGRPAPALDCCLVQAPEP